MNWRILLFVVVMLLVGIAMSIDAAVLCANASGSVFVRAQCMGNEQQLDPVALGLVGPSGISGYEVVVDETAADTSPFKQLIVNCPSEKMALGAGWSVLDPTSAFLEGEATAFEPSFNGSQWLVNAKI